MLMAMRFLPMSSDRLIVVLHFRCQVSVGRLAPSCFRSLSLRNLTGFKRPMSNIKVMWDISHPDYNWLYSH